METKQIPQIDRAIKEWGEAFRKAAKEASNTIEEAGKEWNKFESEEKSMLHNVTVKHEENKVLEEFWVMRAEKKEGKYPIPYSEAVKENELDHAPTLDEIAQFLSDSKADFVSVVQNYRFENELPFC